MSYSVKLQSETDARKECIAYMGRAKYRKFINTCREMTAGKRRTVIYRTVSFACGMVGMRGYLITRAVFRDVIDI